MFEKQSNKAYYIYNIPCTYLLILIHGTILLHLCSPESHSYTQISQSFTPPSVEIPISLLIHSAWRCPFHSYSCVLLHYGFWLSISPYDRKPPTKSRTWVKVLDLSDNLLWLHLLCLPGTAGPDCPASQRNTVNRGNLPHSEQWWRHQGFL